VLQLAVMSAFFGPDQAATEAKLIADPDCRPWVEKYQRSRETVSRTDYEVRIFQTICTCWCSSEIFNCDVLTFSSQFIYGRLT
jgi:L-ascorbate peroxidase